METYRKILAGDLPGLLLLLVCLALADATAAFFSGHRGTMPTAVWFRDFALSVPAGTIFNTALMLVMAVPFLLLSICAFFLLRKVRPNLATRMCHRLLSPLSAVASFCMVQALIVHHATAWIALGVLAIVWFALYRRPFGLRLRACGENPQAAASVGINVRGIRYVAVLASGFLAGLAGSCLVLTTNTQFNSTTVNGHGFIALAVVSFGRWKPLGIGGASLLFGTALAFSIIASDYSALRSLPTEVFNIMPYAITLLTLVIFSGKNYAPLSAGKPYEKGAS